jgi:hypothetical protein
MPCLPDVPVAPAHAFAVAALVRRDPLLAAAEDLVHVRGCELEHAALRLRIRVPALRELLARAASERRALYQARGDHEAARRRAEGNIAAQASRDATRARQIAEGRRLPFPGANVPEAAIAEAYAAYLRGEVSSAGAGKRLGCSGQAARFLLARHAAERGERLRTRSEAGQVGAARRYA